MDFSFFKGLRFNTVSVNSPGDYYIYIYVHIYRDFFSIMLLFMYFEDTFREPREERKRRFWKSQERIQERLV